MSQKTINRGPLVTIIVPSFNQGRYLEETLQSVLSQDYPNIELIVIDGGSRDNSIEIIKKYADQIDYWESAPDRGQSHAINKGYARATGEILNWLCSDDTLMPGAITRVVDAFRNDPAGTSVLGNAIYTNEFSEIIDTCVASYRGYDDLISFWTAHVGIPQPSFFLHRKLLQKSDYFLDEDYHHAMDYDLWCRTLKGEKVILIDEDLATYRRHAEAKTTASDAWRYDKLRISKQYWGSKLSISYWSYWYYCYRMLTGIWSQKQWNNALTGRGKGLKVYPLIALVKCIMLRPSRIFDKNSYTMFISVVLGEGGYLKFKKYFGGCL